MTQEYWQGRIKYLEEFLKDHINRETSERLGIQGRLDFAKNALFKLEDKFDAVSRIHGCLGTDPSIYK